MTNYIRKILCGEMPTLPRHEWTSDCAHNQATAAKMGQHHATKWSFQKLFVCISYSKDLFTLISVTFTNLMYWNNSWPVVAVLFAQVINFNHLTNTAFINYKDLKITVKYYRHLLLGILSTHINLSYLSLLLVFLLC